jgi:hypothetical protein
VGQLGKGYAGVCKLVMPSLAATRKRARVLYLCKKCRCRPAFIAAPRAPPLPACSSHPAAGSSKLGLGRRGLGPACRPDACMYAGMRSWSSQNCACGRTSAAGQRSMCRARQVAEGAPGGGSPSRRLDLNHPNRMPCDKCGAHSWPGHASGHKTPSQPARPCPAQLGSALLSSAQLGLRGSALLGLARPCSAQLARPGPARPCSARPCSARPCSAQLSSACAAPGSAPP